MELDKKQKTIIEEDDLTGEEINYAIDFIIENKKVISLVIIAICLGILFYYLGYIKGYTYAFTGQESYYNWYTSAKCICEERINLRPLYNLSIKK